MRLIAPPARPTLLLLIGLLVLWFAPGCATLVRQPAVPKSLEDQAHIPGLEQVRYRIGDPEDLAAIEREGIESVQRERRVYVIRNSRLDPEWAQVERRTMSIAGRAISSLIQTQGIGDLYRIYLTTQRDGVDFNLAYIPDSFNAPHKEDFDTQYMRQLYAVGYDLAAKGYRWQKKPPGFTDSTGVRR